MTANIQILSNALALGDRELEAYPDKDGTLWLRATDVCEALEYKNVTEAVAFHVKPHQQKRMKVMTRVGLRTIIVVNREGAQNLVMRSTTSKAEEIKSFFAEVVWTALDVDDAYVMPNIRPHNLAKLKARYSDEEVVKMSGGKLVELLEAMPETHQDRETVEMMLGMKRGMEHQDAIERGREHLKKTAHIVVKKTKAEVDDEDATYFNVVDGVRGDWYHVNGKPVWLVDQTDSQESMNPEGANPPRRPIGATTPVTQATPVALTPTGKVKRTNRKLVGRVASPASSGPAPVLR